VEDRVLREAQAAAKLSHPHILTVYEMVREEDRTILFSEYIQVGLCASTTANRRWPISTSWRLASN